MTTEITTTSFVDAATPTKHHSREDNPVNTRILAHPARRHRDPDLTRTVARNIRTAARRAHLGPLTLARRLDITPIAGLLLWTGRRIMVGPAMEAAAILGLTIEDLFADTSSTASAAA